MTVGASYHFRDKPTESENLTSANLNSLQMGMNVKIADAGGLDIDVTAGAYWDLTTTPPSIATFAAVSGITMTGGMTNYVYIDSNGSLAVSMSSFPDPDAEDSIPLAEVVADVSTISAINDRRLRVGLGRRGVASLLFGGNMTGTGKYLQSNAPADATEQASSGPLTEHPNGRAGVITKLTWRSDSADATTDLRLWVGGNDDGVVTLDGANGQVTGLPVAKGATEQVEIQYDAGTAPGNIIVELELELLPF